MVLSWLDEAHATAVKGPTQAEVGGPVAIPRPDHDSAVEAGDGDGLVENGGPFR